MTDNNFQFTSAAVSDRGLSEKRPQNEDSFVELKDYGFFAVADGVGGAQAGEVASQMTVEILSEAFINLSHDADPEETMKRAIECANSSVFQMSQDLPQLASMATTLVALHIAGDVATIGHVGDSRLYRLDSNGQLFRETADHSVVEEEVRAGRMTPEQALTHPSRNVISRAVGAEDVVEIDLKMQIVRPGSTFLLCSDGITRHIEDWEITALLGSDQPPEAICQQMKEICYSRGAEDNLTAVIVRFPQESVPAVDMLDTIIDADPEQVTIASARPEPIETDDVLEIPEEPSSTHEEYQAAEESETEHVELQHESQPEEEVETPQTDLYQESPVETEENDDQAYLIEDAPELYINEPEPETVEPYTSSSVVVSAQKPLIEKELQTHKEQKPYQAAQPVGNFASKTFSALLFLLIGGVLGYGAHYFMMQQLPQPEAAATPQMVEKSPDIPLTTFEVGRRIVDKDPAAYINANAASSQSSEDYFLLGRAFLLTGKGWEAKRSFNEAKNRLAQADAANAKTLASEIAMALVIIGTPGASEALSKELSAGNTGINSNSNTAVNPANSTNVNTAIKTNQPIR